MRRTRSRATAAPPTSSSRRSSGTSFCCSRRRPCRTTSELYNLVTLLRPGQLGTWEEFREAHLVAGDHRQPRDPEALRALTHEVMIRTRRSSVVDDLNLPARRPRHPEVRLTTAEDRKSTRSTEFLRPPYRQGLVEPVEAEESEDETTSPRRRRPKKATQQL